MIQLKDLNKYFGDKHVLKNINANFLPGVANLVIGASGGGKSVLVKTMVGLETPSSGSVLFEDRDYNRLEYEEKQVLRREIGMLFQGTALFDSLTVEQNVEFPLLMFSNMTKEERQDRVNNCLSRVNLVNANKKTPAEISGGMKKRVGIARAIALNIKYGHHQGVWHHNHHQQPRHENGEGNWRTHRIHASGRKMVGRQQQRFGRSTKKQQRIGCFCESQFLIIQYLLTKRSH
ncbi:MAG: hypothetical protein RLZZ47_216 [Bacteroidota bacterium]